MRPVKNVRTHVIYECVIMILKDAFQHLQALLLT